MIGFEDIHDIKHSETAEATPIRVYDDLAFEGAEAKGYVLVRLPKDDEISEHVMEHTRNILSHWGRPWIAVFLNDYRCKSIQVGGRLVHGQQILRAFLFPIQATIEASSSHDYVVVQNPPLRYIELAESLAQFVAGFGSVDDVSGASPADDYIVCYTHESRLASAYDMRVKTEKKLYAIGYMFSTKCYIRLSGLYMPSQTLSSHVLAYVRTFPNVYIADDSSRHHIDIVIDLADAGTFFTEVFRRHLTATLY